MEQSFPALSPDQAPALRALPESFAEATSEPLSSVEALPLTLPEPEDARHDFARLAAGLGFAAVYGLALGARAGGMSLVRHSLAASAGLGAVALLGVPSLFVLLALANVPVSPGAMLAMAARASSSAGFVLAGLAPSAALLAVTVQSAEATASIASAGLALAGAIGMYQMLRTVRPLVSTLPFQLLLKSYALLSAFGVFAVLLAARVWSALPILQGGR